MTYSETPPIQKTGKVQAIAIMTLINGILNIIYGLSLGLGLLLGVVSTAGVSLCCTPLAFLPIVLGIFEVIGGSKLISTQPRRFDVQTIAIFEIINVITGNIPSLVIGILNLVFYGDPLTKSYIIQLPK